MYMITCVCIMYIYIYNYIYKMIEDNAVDGQDASMTSYSEGRQDSQDSQSGRLCRFFDS